MVQRFQQMVQVDQADRKAIDWLAEMPECQDLSRSELKAAMQKGAVWHSRGKSQPQRLRRASRLLNLHDRLYLYFDSSVLAQVPQEPALIADEGGYSVWDKPSGMLCQGSKYGDHTTLSRWAEARLKPERPAFIVHRLDRATRGLVLLAHSKLEARRLSRLFEQRQVKKTYRAVVHGCAPEGPLRCQLSVNGREAISHIRRLAYDEQADLSLVEVGLETGRKHQIRIHLSQLGLPILGDRLHGEAGAGEVDLQLQCCHLAFEGFDRWVCYKIPARLQLMLPEG